MKRIYTVQHTQSEHHTNGMVGSWTDWNLTDLGKQQADRIAEKLKQELDGKERIIFFNNSSVFIELLSGRVERNNLIPCMGSRIAKNETISGSTVTVRVIPGPQDYLFSEEGITNFYSCDGFTVTAMCDRQGYRLKGPKVFLKEKGSIVSDGIAKPI